MDPTPFPAEHAWLEDFLLGRLDDEQQERAEEELGRSPALLTLLQQIEGTTPLLEGVPVRMIPQPAADATDLSDLVQRLQRLRPADDTGRAALADTVAPEPSATAPPLELSFLAPPQEPDELGRLGGFRILEVLGAGGMGLVLRAEDTTIRRAVAMKVMKSGIAARPGARARFLREASLAASLDHEHIAAIHHVGEDRGVPFFTMPLLAGETLETRLQRESVLGVDEVQRIGREAGEGLAAAHASGLIHRDIKPANLWLFRRRDGTGPRDQVKLLDFGLARPLLVDERLTESNQLLGTPAYMSPEQVQNGPVSSASDLFSLGAVLYRAATGQAPFGGRNLMELLQNVVNAMPKPPHEVRPDVPRTLSAFIMQMLEKDPRKRPSSAQAVVEEIDRIRYQATTASERTPPPAASKPEPPPGNASRSRFSSPTGSVSHWPAARRRRWRVAAGSGLVVVGLLAAVCLAWLGRKLDSAGDAAKDITADPKRVKYSGRVDMIVWSKDGPDIRKLRLGDPNALPLHKGDTVRIEAAVTPAAYLYLFWIGTDGKATPLHPWRPGKWDTRPAEEEKRDALALPMIPGKGLKLLDNSEGMETLVLLAFTEPLKAGAVGDEEIQHWFAGLGEQRPVQNRFAAVWFENGRVVESDQSRQRVYFEVTDINDPVLRVQERLHERLGKRAVLTAAVSFARERR